jgi:hypothetical protein
VSRRPIEAIEHHSVFEAGLLQVAFKCLAIASLDLIGQQQRQERGVIGLLSARQRQARGQGRHHVAELQPLEQVQAGLY